MDIKEYIESGKAVLGIEFGSTRIKACLVGEDMMPVAQGSFTWENRLENNIWTYHEDEMTDGLRAAYADLCADVEKKYGTKIVSLASVGISAMMHGYLAFDADDRLLVPFRTWRNTITEDAAAELTELFGFNIPERWSIAHLYHAILAGEEHVPAIRKFTTLAGYIHFLLTGENVLGIGDASGMFPVSDKTMDYDADMISKFRELIKPRNFPWDIADILPRVLPAGAEAGKLTESGAKLLDPTGTLRAGIPFCPPEGDAGTGMAATNSVGVRTGNISAGTSVFAMTVLEKPLENVHREIDVVATPDGLPTAMVHCNNCTSDLNAWVGIFREVSLLFGGSGDLNEIYTKLYQCAMQGAPDCGGLVSYNTLSGEPVIGLEEGRPMQVRLPDAKFTLADFMRSNLYSAMAAIKLGMDILTKSENVKIDGMVGHGGMFKTKGTAQKLMAGALGIPITVMSTAGEGGPWGMALLAAYSVYKNENETLSAFLGSRVFGNAEKQTEAPDKSDSEGFDAYMERYLAGLDAEKKACSIK